MAKRKRIGILYSYDENWVGGSYYIQNLISCLNYLPKDDQPLLFVVTKDRKTFNELKVLTNYANLSFISDRLSKIKILSNRITKNIFKFTLFTKNINLDVVFPLHFVPESLEKTPTILFWIPDLQEKFLPFFFSVQEVQKRHIRYEKMILEKHPILFSSYTAKREFESYFPNSTNEKKVLQFSVVHPEINLNDIDLAKQKYNIDEKYFFSPNQFWQHKNHIAVIEATRILKESGIIVNIIFTGKEYDYRNPDYTTQLKEKVLEYKLEKQIKFLGFIDRNDQLLLMKGAISIIQPSLFEGWSTVIEDSKALNQTIIASDISVHREQLQDYAYYFAPTKHSELAKVMLEILNTKNKKRYDLDYKNNILNFALKLKNVIENTN